MPVKKMELINSWFKQVELPIRKKKNREKGEEEKLVF